MRVRLCVPNDHNSDAHVNVKLTDGIAAAPFGAAPFGAASFGGGGAVAVSDDDVPMV